MSKHTWRLAVVALVSGLLLFSSARLEAIPQDSGGMSDSAITSAIQAKLYEDPVLKTQDIRVSTLEGVVTLTGTVATELQRAAVDRIASTQPGVVKVVDGMSVGNSAPPASVESPDAQGSAPPEAPDQQDSYPPEQLAQAQSVPATLTLPAGTLITIRTTNEISSDHNRAGDSFTATLDQPLVSNGWVVMRHGQTVMGRVAVAKKGGRVRGVSQLGLALDQVTLVDGQQVRVHTRLLQASGGASKGRDASAVGTTTGVGAIIGAIAGGGEGAGIGAGIGAAAGVAGVLLTHGRPTVIMPESLLTFRLESPITISTAQSTAAFRPVTEQDYPQHERNRPDRFAVRPPRPYGYYYPYWAYYGWGPYYPYSYGLGYYSWWGRGWDDHRGARYYYRGDRGREWHGEEHGRRGGGRRR